jgi:hypothetical protein
MKISIHGTTFELADRYTEGHAINAREASVLNQTIMENVGNNFRDKVKSHAGTPEELQAQFADYASKYEFGVRSSRGPSKAHDPVGAEALRLAVVFVKEKVRKAGKSIKDFGAAKLNAAAQALLDKNDALAESFRADAQRLIDAQGARSEGGSEELDALLASVPDAAPGETAEAPAEAPADEAAAAPRGRRNRT